MEQFRQVGEVLGSLKALMVFRDDIRINQRQCCLLVDAFNLGFDRIAEEIKQNLKFNERTTKWKALEQPLKELHRIFRQGEQYIRQCLETKDWWVKAISLSQNTDCIEFHIHNLLWCLPVVFEAIEAAAEISGCDHHEIQSTRFMFMKKYEKEWMEPKLFQRKFGKQYLVSHDIRKRIETVWREDRWVLLQTIKEKRSDGTTGRTKQEVRIMDLLSKNLDSKEQPFKGKLFPSSILVGSKDYHVRRRLGNSSQYKEIQWMGEDFAVRHFFGDIESLIPEISDLSSLAHPNIMHILCGFSDEEKKECFLLMELMNKDLRSYIKEVCSSRKRVPFSLPTTVDIILQIARGMEYLHSHKICHGDLNPCNILVRNRTPSEGHLHIKIAGFGLKSVKKFSPQASLNQMATSPFIWYAPEVLSEQEHPGYSCNFKYTEKADVYSFGMICFELLTGKVPFEEGHLQGDKMSRNIRAGERPLFPFQTPKYLASLTKKCWQIDPIQRPKFSAICRILRYIKRFLVMNPDHSQPDAPMPLIDYFDLETRLSKNFTKWASAETSVVTEIPFQMFAYRVIEKEKTTVNVRDKSSESGSSEGTSSISGDENGHAADDPFSSPSVASRTSSLTRTESNSSRTSSLTGSESNKKILAKSTVGKANRNSGQNRRGRALRPPQMTPCGRSLRMNSEGQLQSPVMSPCRRKSPGHASDSELT